MKFEVGLVEEFDLLKFMEDKIVNIELKHTLPDSKREAAENQLKRHILVLKQTDLPVLAFTFISDVQKFFTISDNGQYVECSIEDVSNSLKSKYISDDLLSTIDKNKLIVSPYNMPEAFIDHKYYLTHEQLRVKNEILSEITYNKHCVIGGPGTGKSIILFDLAVKYKRLGKKVLVIFCGMINKQDEISRIMGFDVVGVTKARYKNIEEYDIVLLDETQRLYPKTFEAVSKYNNEKVIYFIDHSQVLHPSEQNLNIEKILTDDATVMNHKLTYKIRTDKKMVAFIKKFLNRYTRSANVSSFKNISVNHFFEKKDLKAYIKYMVEEHEFTSIELTEYKTKTTNAKKREHVSIYSKSVHDVVGREYEKVIIIIDKYFTYDSNGNLKCTYSENYPYLTEQCIFEALTRVKGELNIVVWNNNEIYSHVNKILTEGC